MERSQHWQQKWLWLQSVNRWVLGTWSIVLPTSALGKCTVIHKLDLDQMSERSIRTLDTKKYKLFLTPCSKFYEWGLFFQMLLDSRSHWHLYVRGVCLREGGGVNIWVCVYWSAQSSGAVSESTRGGSPGLFVLTSLMVSVNVKQYWTMLRHWSQFVPNNMSTDIRGHEARLHHILKCLH